MAGGRWLVAGGWWLHWIDMLGDEQGSDARFEVPAGFCVAPVPSPEQLNSTHDASQALVTKRLLYNWPGMGWLQGRITALNTNRRRRIAGSMCNFVCEFKEDEAGQSTWLSLQAALYGESCEEDAWVILNAA